MLLSRLDSNCVVAPFGYSTEGARKGEQGKRKAGDALRRIWMLTELSWRLHQLQGKAQLTLNPEHLQPSSSVEIIHDDTNRFLEVAAVV
jgi:hypothetical protein